MSLSRKTFENVEEAKKEINRIKKHFKLDKELKQFLSSQSIDKLKFFRGHYTGCDKLLIKCLDIELKKFSYEAVKDFVDKLIDKYIENEIKANLQEKTIFKHKSTNLVFSSKEYYRIMIEDSITYNRTVYDEIENDTDFIDVTETYELCEDCKKYFEIERQNLTPSDFTRIICDDCFTKAKKEERQLRIVGALRN